MKLKNRSILVTGGAGFIGSNLVDSLIEENKLTVYDNFSSGRKAFLSAHFRNEKFRLVVGDMLNFKSLMRAMKGIDLVFHLAANPDVRLAEKDTRVHFEQNTVATHSLLEAMRLQEVKEMGFTSTSTVYGEAKIIPTPENYGPLLPISIYGASKLACESMISAYSDNFNITSSIYRLANVIGKRGTHGVLVDFIRKLRKNPEELEILGDGTQKKSYVAVEDCVRAMLIIARKTGKGVEAYNIGSEDWIDVRRIAGIVCGEMGLKKEKVKFRFAGGRAWAGDVKLMLLSIKKLKSLGFKPKHDSEQAVVRAVRSLLEDGL